MIDKIWLFFYSYLLVPLFYVLALFVSLFNKKLREGIKGRKRLFEELIINASAIDKTKKLIWFHSSSLGEFEQAKPIIEKLKRQVNANILVTFFSPSGYVNSKKYPFADLVSYLPFDFKSQADKFIKIVNPHLAIFMRYDIWPNHINALWEKNIPSLLVDATMRDNSPRITIPFSKAFHKRIYNKITKILTVSENDAKNFLRFKLNKNHVISVGDTRFDRVYQRSLIAKERNLINTDFIANRKVMVAGSTWDADEDVLIPAFIALTKYDKDILFIIVPHEPTEVHIERLENDFASIVKTIRFSEMNNYAGERVILVDSIGILLTLYYYAHVAFIGGSFKSNIHNVLEAAVYGVPVLFGPKIYNSQEVTKLLEAGGGIMVNDKKDVYKQLRILFSNEKIRAEKGNISSNFVKQNLGATEKIILEVLKTF